ncbi:MAG: hypothetical protein ACXWJ8_15140 [Xanthobacteraceae bacterium]
MQRVPDPDEHDLRGQERPQAGELDDVAQGQRLRGRRGEVKEHDGDDEGPRPKPPCRRKE